MHSTAIEILNKPHFFSGFGLFFQVILFRDLNWWSKIQFKKIVEERGKTQDSRYCKVRIKIIIAHSLTKILRVPDTLKYRNDVFQAWFAFESEQREGTFVLK